MRFPLGIGLVEFSAGPSYIPPMGKLTLVDVRAGSRPGKLAV
jgi:hypothetical protein